MNNEHQSGEPAALQLNDQLGARLQTVTLVEVMPTKAWAEKDVTGTVKIMVQHEGDKPHCLVEIHYNYAYTSNAHQRQLAGQILDLLGGGENRA